MFNKKFFILLTAVVFGLSSQIATASEKTTSQKLRLDLLYVQDAPAAKVTQVCNKIDSCHDQLVLENVSPYILTFNNGKPPIGGSILTTTFLKQYYAKSGKSSGLNTLLMTYNDNKVQEHLIILKNPVYLPQKKQMVFEMSYMQNSKPIANNTQLNNVALFIDAICATCFGG